MKRPRELMIQESGSSHSGRIPAIIAGRVGFEVGQPVRMSMQDSAPMLTLAQRLALFDAERHGGEAMATGRTERETV